MEEYISQIVNPLLQYLKAILPPPLYSFVVNGLSYTLTAVTAIARLSRTLIDKNSSEWNTTAILPPIITILAAYMALASLYRTASWIIRITIFFLKWASIIGIVMAITQYFASDGRENQGGNGKSIFVGVSEGGISNRNNKYRQSTKPKPWDSFKTHEEWQYQQRRENGVVHSQAQKIMDSIVTAAGRIVQGDWLDAATKLTRGDDETASMDETQGQGRVGKTRSR